ncbi:putative arylsulfatase regulatory protein (plasmid) [Calothrix brevissima NIES-22]|nr:putative arylsulfatase regulatory protein [Calothrix brevissima NIES-22]
MTTMKLVEQNIQPDYLGVPFNTFVVKVVSTCNLNCSYCYMYNLQDQTYKQQPAVISQEVTKALTDKIISHYRRHQMSLIHITLHGGEPLLMGKERLQTWVRQVGERLHQEGIPHEFAIQSNGTLLDSEWIDLLAEAKVGIGISIDGPQQFHDMFRVDHKGNGSFNKVLANIRLLQEHPKGKEIFLGLLSVLNIDIPPTEFFEFWEFLNVRALDILLPDANHAYPPRQGRISYGDWMIQFFDLWLNQNREDRIVRFFNSILRLIFGYPFSVEYIGGKPVGVCVIETNGDIEPLDVLKSCKDGITKMGLNVLNNEFDDLYSFPLTKIYQQGARLLCDTCKNCEVLDVCGGGYLPHRYSHENDFNNPSVYCDDLYRLILHIRRRVGEFLPKDMQASLSGSAICSKL